MIAALLQGYRVSTRRKPRDPEKLWLHYCLAMVVFFGLLVTMYVLNWTDSQREITLAEAIDRSNQQQYQTKVVIDLARAFEQGEAPDNQALLAAIAGLNATHTSLAGQGTRTRALQDHYYQGQDPLSTKIRDFLSLSRLLAQGSSTRRTTTLSRLETLYHDGGLQDDLRAATELFAATLADEAKQKLHRQSLVLVAATIVLVMEAGLIFLPAHRSVQSSLRALRRQTLVLKTSRRKLREMNKRLTYMVSHDQLTGLPNRSGLVQFITDALSDNTLTDAHFVLVGIDDFKAVNDMFGPAQGDALLKSVAQALTSCVNTDDYVARVGSDEFVVVSHEPIASLIEAVLTSVHHPFTVNGRRISIQCSIGHLQIEGDPRAPLDLVSDAAVAMRFAKAAGGGIAREFTQDMRSQLEQLQQLQIELREAIRNGEIEPWFQPQVRLSDGRLHGAEVLARWRHPKRGLLSPHEFLPAAEQAGLIVELDHLVWSTALRHARAWQEEQIWRPCISLNAAPETISDPNLLERFLLTIRRLGLEADQVVVEVLETTLIEGKDDMAAINIDSLAECGISLELDDFGTGYASLSRLTQLPVRGIKLDRSLVSPLPDQGADSVIRAVLALAAELGLHVVAEGVEEEAQASHLCNRGCAIAQGFGYAKPMSPADFQVWLEENAQSPVQVVSPLAATG